MGNFNATVGGLWLLLKFQLYSHTRCGAREVCSMVGRVLTATTGEELTLQCNWLGTGREAALFTHIFVGAIS